MMTINNTQNNNQEIRNRIQRNHNSKKIVIGGANGQAGFVSYDPLAEKGKKENMTVRPLPETMDSTTATMALVAAAIAAEAKNANGQKVDIYCPNDNAFRVRGMFTRLKNGEAESISGDDAAALAEFRGDSIEAYVSAMDKAYEGLKAAKEAGKYVQIHTLDDISFTRLPEDIAKNWKLSGITVRFSNGKATIPAGTKMSDGKLTSMPITINGEYIVGVRTLGVRPIGGNSGKKELVALKDAKYNADLQTLQGMRMALFAAMPAEQNSFQAAYAEAQAARQAV
jgi:hypothetical protein